MIDVGLTGELELLAATLNERVGPSDPSHGALAPVLDVEGSCCRHHATDPLNVKPLVYWLKGDKNGVR